MKKIILLILVMILLVNNVYAIPFATIGLRGLSFISTQAASTATQIICVSNPIICFEGKVIGQVTGELFQVVKDESPEIAKAIETYNQVQGYLDEGAEIVQELKVDDQGYVEEGIMEFTKEASVGNLVGPNVQQGDITAKNAILEKKAGITTLKLKQDGILKIKDSKTGKTNVYSNIKEGGFLKLNDKGEITEADITSNTQAAYAFGDNVVNVPKDTRIYFINGDIQVNGRTGTSFEWTRTIEGIETGKNKLTILGGNSLTISGNTVRGLKFSGDGFTVSGTDKDLLGEVTFDDKGRIINLAPYTIATINNIEHKTTLGDDLNIYYADDPDFDINIDISKILNKNYFGYGKDKILLGGNGFTSTIKEGNEIFPEYKEKIEGPYLKRIGKLEFTPQNGNLEVSKLSSQGEPLLLDVKGEGDFNIKNGKWNIKTENGELLVRRERVKSIDTDMRFSYTTPTGDFRYDLDATNIYTTKNQVVIRNLNEATRKKEELENKLDEAIIRYDTLKNDPKYKRVIGEIEALQSGVDIETKKLNDVASDIINYEEEKGRELTRQELLAERPDLVNRLDSTINTLTAAESAVLARKSVSAQLSEAGLGQKNIEIYTLSEDIDSYKKEIPHQEAIISDAQKSIYSKQAGFFGQIIEPSEGADSSLSDPVGFENMPVTRAGADTQPCSTPRTCAGGILLAHDAYQQKLKEEEVFDFDAWFNNEQATEDSETRLTTFRVIEPQNIRQGDMLVFGKENTGTSLVLENVLEIPPESGNKFYKVWGAVKDRTGNVDSRLAPSLIPESKVQQELLKGRVIIKRAGPA